MNDRKLTPGKGILRILEMIAKLEAVLGRHPVGKEIHAYQVLTSGKTGQNSETMQEMIGDGLIGNANGYYVTVSGLKLLKEYGIEI